MIQRGSLEQLAQTDPAVAPLTRLQMIALDAAARATWADGIPPLTFQTDSAPLLYDQSLVVDRPAVKSLSRVSITL